MANLINSVKAILLYLMMFISACFGVVFIQTPCIPLAFLNRRRYLQLCSRALGYYLLMVTCLIEDVLGIKIVITGDDLSKDRKQSLLILNHRTRLDWMFLWMLYSRLEALHELKAVLKSDLKQIPGPGWAMQHSAYLFLKRSWAEDKITITKMIEYYKSCQASITLMLFPEGTNLTNNTKQRSNEYAVKQAKFNRPYEYCLHPRVTGFTHLLTTMEKNTIIDNVVDVTIGYEGAIPLAELDLIKGRIPSTIHFHVKRYPVTGLPKSDDEIGNWLLERWDEKEDQLKEFYEKKQFDDISNRVLYPNDMKVRLQRRLAVIFWILFICFWSYCIVAFMKMRFFVLLVCFFHFILDTFANGLIDFVCQLDENYRQSELKRTQATVKQD